MSTLRRGARTTRGVYSRPGRWCNRSRLLAPAPRGPSLRVTASNGERESIFLTARWDMVARSVVGVAVQ
eukprot:6225176-Prymnesium_polylepis.1